MDTDMPKPKPMVVYSTDLFGSQEGFDCNAHASPETY